MEPSIGHGSMGSNMFTETEWEVARSLLHLSRMPFTWGCKRMRSAIQVSHRGAGRGGGGTDVTPSYHPMMIKREALSPANSLLFLPTQSLKSLRKKLFLKRKREDHLKIIEANASLNKGIDTVRQYNDQVKVIKLKLKARGDKDVYQRLVPSNGPKSEFKKPSLQLDHVNASVNSSNFMAESQWQKQMQMPSTSHYPPMMMTKMLNQTSRSSQIRNNVGATQFQYSSGHPTMSLLMPFSSSGAKGKLNGNTCPLAIPYINFLPSCQPFDEIIAKKDLSRNMAAQARQRRIQILNLKNSIRNIKQRSS